MGKWNGGYGPMSVVESYEVRRQIAEEEKALKTEFKGGIEFGCALCGEEYKTLKDVPIDEINALSKWLAKGQCPYCQDGTMSYYLRLKANNMHRSNIPHTFIKDGKEYYVLRLGK